MIHSMRTDFRESTYSYSGEKRTVPDRLLMELGLIRTIVCGKIKYFSYPKYRYVR